MVVIIPTLPRDICNYKFLSVFEVLLRFGNEYMGSAVECIAGPKARNHWLRMLTSSFILFQIRVPFKKHLKIQNFTFGNTPCRLYSPVDVKSKACIIFIHGGGWCLMNAKYFDYIMSAIVKDLGCSILSIDYGLAPRNVFPVGLNQCWVAIEDFYLNHADNLSIDKTRLAILADSAGGNIAGALAQRSARLGKNYFKCQILVYPITSCLDFQNSSYKEYYEKYNKTGLLNPEGVARWMLFYLGIEATKENVKKVMRNQHISDKLRQDFNLKSECKHQVDLKLSEKFEEFARNPDFCILKSKDLRLLPKTLVITAGYDICFEESYEYYCAMKSEGVQATWKHFPTAFHGILNLAGSQTQKAVKREITDYIRKNLF
uniref:Abhydrolase_3 domain-containing protein n=1 Tax=Rhabditophanes sp. KR3021 TaxID=114890 RepID=A0AC35U2W7_9BILA